MSKLRTNQLETLDGLNTVNVSDIVDDIDTASVTTSTGTQTLTNALDDRVRKDISPANVKDYGAKGDYDPITQEGSDDTQAFDDASSASGWVYIPEGRYFVTKTYSEHTTFGPGKVYLNGTELLANFIRAGVSSGHNNKDKFGGFVIGGQNENGNGVIFRSGANPSWTRLEPMHLGSECQFQIYTGAFAGKARSVIGTAFIDIEYGFVDDPKIEIGDLITWSGNEYRILSKPSSSRLEIEHWDGSPVSFVDSWKATYMHCYQWAYGTCDTDGTTVTRVSGDPFIGRPQSDDFKIAIDGDQYYVSSRESPDSLTLESSAGVKTGVPYVLKCVPGSRAVAIHRIQSVRGGTEENFAISINQSAEVLLETQFAGQGEYMPMLFRTGPTNDSLSSRDALKITPQGNFEFNGDVTGGIDAKVKISQHQAASSLSGGASDKTLAILGANFSGTDARWLSIVSRNNFQAPYIQGGRTGNVSGFSVNPNGGDVVFGEHGPAPGALQYSFNGIIGPHQDNQFSNGTAGFRYTVVYAATGSINTSDMREKQQVTELSDVERAVASQLKGMIRKFKWNDAVDQKGDGARWHFGVLAQEVRDVFAEHGLDAHEYGLFCYDEWDAEDAVIEEWDAEYDAEGNLVKESGSKVVQEAKPAGNRYGVRYDELLAFIVSAM